VAAQVQELVQVEVQAAVQAEESALVAGLELVQD